MTSDLETTVGLVSNDVTEKFDPNNSHEITDVVPMTKCQILRSLFILSAAFFFMFTSFHSMSNLQSSLNKDEGIGTTSLAVVYVAMIISSLFISSLAMTRLGCKWTMCISMVTYVIYMAANIYPVWGTMVPAAILCGLGAGPLWASNSTYLTQISGWYASITDANVKETLSFFFGIFYTIHSSSKISGNLLASLILKQPVDSNITMTSQEIKDCVDNKQWAVSNASTLERPDITTVYTICSIWIVFAVLGIIALVFLTPITVDGTKSTIRRETTMFNKIISTVKHLWKSKKQKILIPISMYYGIAQAFMVADFTKSLVACTLGIEAVGYVMLCNGMCNTISTALIGRLARTFGQIPFFTLAFLSHGSIHIILIIWKPGPEYDYVLYVFVGLWGIADAVLKSQLLALYGHLFDDKNEEAFGCYFMLESAGSIAALFYSSVLSTDIKLYILLVLLICSAISYYAIEYLDHRRHPHHQDTETPTASQGSGKERKETEHRLLQK